MWSISTIHAYPTARSNFRWNKNRGSLFLTLTSHFSLSFLSLLSLWTHEPPSAAGRGAPPASLVPRALTILSFWAPHTFLCSSGSGSSYSPLRRAALVGFSSSAGWRGQRTVVDRQRRFSPSSLLVILSFFIPSSLRQKQQRRSDGAAAESLASARVHSRSSAPPSSGPCDVALGVVPEVRPRDGVTSPAGFSLCISCAMSMPTVRCCWALLVETRSEMNQSSSFRFLFLTRGLGFRSVLSRSMDPSIFRCGLEVRIGPSSVLSLWFEKSESDLPFLCAFSCDSFPKIRSTH